MRKEVKFELKCDLCNGHGYIPVNKHTQPFPKGDWFECPQCFTSRKLVGYERVTTPALIFNFQNNPLAI